MPAPPQTAPDWTNADMDALAEDFFANAGPQNVIWEGPDYPKPKKLKMDTISADPFGTGGTPLVVFTADTTKAHGYAISEPANASATSQAQVARLKDKYE